MNYKYKIEQSFGGVMEQPEITYYNEDTIVASNEKEAKDIYNTIHSSRNWSGYIKERLGETNEPKTEAIPLDMNKHRMMLKEIERKKEVYRQQDIAREERNKIQKEKQDRLDKLNLKEYQLTLVLTDSSYNFSGELFFQDTFEAHNEEHALELAKQTKMNLHTTYKIKELKEEYE